MGFPVSKTGYFVYANAMKTEPKFDGRLEFTMSILPYEGKSRLGRPYLAGNPRTPEFG